MSLFNNVPCRQRTNAALMPIANATVNGASAPVYVANAEQNALPYCDTVSIVDEFMKFVKDEPLIAAGLAFLVYYVFVKK